MTEIISRYHDSCSCDLSQFSEKFKNQNKFGTCSENEIVMIPLVALMLAHGTNTTSTTQQSATVNNVSKNSSMTGRPGIRSHIHTARNSTSGPGDGDDPNIPNTQEAIKKHCKISTNMINLSEIKDTAENEANTSIYEESFSSVLPTHHQSPIIDTFYDSVSVQHDKFDKCELIPKLTSTKIAQDSVISEIVLSPAEELDNSLSHIISPTAKSSDSKTNPRFRNVSRITSSRKRANRIHATQSPLVAAIP